MYCAWYDSFLKTCKDPHVVHKRKITRSMNINCFPIYILHIQHVGPHEYKLLFLHDDLLLFDNCLIAESLATIENTAKLHVLNPDKKMFTISLKQANEQDYVPMEMTLIRITSQTSCLLNLLHSHCRS